MVPHLPDAGPAWYYWKLAQPTVLSRVVVWSLYAAHQLVSFGLIFYAQRVRPPYVSGLHRFNVLALAVNALFALLHLLQTHLTYDGLAQDVHVFSSLGSVAVLLIWVLLIESPRRGLLFGWKPQVLSGPIADFARRTHGYYFSWAIVYTFWFHPAEATRGHLMGFFYLLLVLLQGSLFFTRVHVNRWWTLALELLVLVHGTVVAIDQGNGLWPMFLLGFAAIFVVSQMHGLSWSVGVRVGVGLAWLAGVVLLYARTPARLNEVVRIPFIDYLGVAVLTALFALGVRLFAKPTRE